MDADTAIGGPQHSFPLTRHSIVRAARSESAAVREQAFEELIAVYWKPVYKYIRLKWSAANEEAKDLTQDFFAAAFEKSYFDSYDPLKSRFRTFLRVCVDGSVANARKASARIKRGGQLDFLSLDFDAAEKELAGATSTLADPEEFFRHEWLRSLFSLAVDDLRAHCTAAGKMTHFALFERYDLDPEASEGASYAQLANEFALPVSQVTNFLAYARREFRRRLLNRLGRVCGSDAEYRVEAARLLGSDR